MRQSGDDDEVADAIRRVAEDVILPRFRSLGPHETFEKGPADLVTVADLEAEQELTRALRDRDTDGLVVGEEAIAADPSLLDRATAADRVWVIDPIDGTSNFVAGSADFAVVVALVEAGVTTAGWIFQPAHDRMYTARRGAGAFIDGRPLLRRPAPPEVAGLRGVVVTRLLDEHTAARVDQRVREVGALTANRAAAGIQYPRVAEGDLDFVLYWRTLPWDHAAGSLLLEEAGGRAARLDGSDYEPWSDRRGLVLAADRATHERVTALLAPGGDL